MTSFGSNEFARKVVEEWNWDHWRAQVFFTEHSFLAYFDTSDEFTFIVNFFICEENRGKGYGKAAFAEFKKFVRLKYPSKDKIYAEVQFGMDGLTERLAMFIAQGFKVMYTTDKCIGIAYTLEEKDER